MRNFRKKVETRTKQQSHTTIKDAGRYINYCKKSKRKFFDFLKHILRSEATSLAIGDGGGVWKTIIMNSFVTLFCQIAHVVLLIILKIEGLACIHNQIPINT